MQISSGSPTTRHQGCMDGEINIIIIIIYLHNMTVTKHQGLFS